MELKSTLLESLKFLDSQEDDLGLELSIKDLITDLKNIKNYHKNQYPTAPSADKTAFQTLVNEFYDAVNEIIDNQSEVSEVLRAIKIDTSKIKDAIALQNKNQTESQNE